MFMAISQKLTGVLPWI